jgi:2-isopropylmalate synthase
MGNTVKIYDTTLRDGTQGEGISFSVADKVRIAQRLDAFGVDYIEGGFPGSNPRDIAFFAEARNLRLRHARLAAFGATRRAGVKAAEDPQLRQLLESGMPVLTIVGKTWLMHVEEILRTTPEENLAMIEDSVRFLVSEGREVIYDAEHFFDGYLDNPDYALRTLEAAERGGASNLTLCETNGGRLVPEVARIVAAAVGRFGGDKVGVHCHNDSGLGVAVSLAGIEAGASLVQGTMNGYGERVGNANLVSILPNLLLKMDRPRTAPPIWRNCAIFRSSSMSWRTCGPMRRRPSWAVQPSPTRADCMPTPRKRWRAATNTSTRRWWATARACSSPTWPAVAVLPSRRRNWASPSTRSTPG